MNRGIPEDDSDDKLSVVFEAFRSSIDHRFGFRYTPLLLVQISG